MLFQMIRKMKMSQIYILYLQKISFCVTLIILLVLKGKMEE
ncbi:hypothetical protein T472_0219790 [Youngiibacter fragilis 232.1]|uniref:Uncharacterized protein n=1 Tax=Youngiibacter fragilis 232.1 TaxID=994573 RepID=V7HZ55_9CLOT|nr:hypothetical protein T472_0219790 [Youngiibacter fragilis 232.1]